MTVESVTQAVSNLALQFGEEDADPGAMVSLTTHLHAEIFTFLPQIQSFFYFYTCIFDVKIDLVSTVLFHFVFFSQSRPFGVALLFGGLDEKGPQLYVNILKMHLTQFSDFE